MTNYTQTKTAQHNRTKKAQRLALAAADLGLLVYELQVERSTVADGTRREKVRKHAGMKSKPSDATWIEALMLLQAAIMTVPGTLPCGMCGQPMRRVRTDKGTILDLDVYAHPAGNVFPETINGKVVAKFMAGHDPALPEGTPLFRLHTRSCPKGKDATKRRHAEAPKCRVCILPLSGSLAYSHPEYDTHPTCYDD